MLYISFFLVEGEFRPIVYEIVNILPRILISDMNFCFGHIETSPSFQIGTP